MSKTTISNVRLVKTRNFSLHHVLICIAETALENAEKEKLGSFYNELVAITFSALAIETIANIFGEKLIADWDEFESSNPIAKLRVICSHLKIETNSDLELWAAVKWLIRTRNKIAHAKPEVVVFDKVMRKETAEKIRRQIPASKLEKEINLGSAKRAVKTVSQMLGLLTSKIPIEEAYLFDSDGFIGSISPC